MPSEKVLQSKKEIVAALAEKFQRCPAAVLVDYKGITVDQDTKLRKELREAGIDYSVEKNTMLRFALANTQLTELSDVLEGTTAIAFSGEDVIAPARILGKYAADSKGKFAIKKGFIEGKIYSADQVMELSKLPSKEILLAMAFGGLKAPITKLACVIKAIAEKEPA